MQSISFSDFETKGYQVFEQVIPLEYIESCRAFLAEQIEATLKPVQDEIGCQSDADILSFIKKINEEPNGLGIESLSKATRDTLSGHFSLEARMSTLLQEIACSTKLVSILKTILKSSKVYMHMPPTARFVLPGNIYAGVPPHQDISYNKHMTDFVTVWVPFVDIDEECGGVIIFDGSGQHPEYVVHKQYSNFWLEAVPTDGFRPNSCQIKPGDVLILNKLIIHSSSPNKSRRTRISTDFRFFGEGGKSTKHYLDMEIKEVVSPGV